MNWNGRQRSGVWQDGTTGWYNRKDCRMVSIPTIVGWTSTAGWTDKLLELQVKQTVGQTCANLTSLTILTVSHISGRTYANFKVSDQHFVLLPI